MKPLTHDDIMRRKCGLCLGNNKLRPISVTNLERIKKYMYSGYSIGLCPGVICSSCDPALRDRQKVVEQGAKPKHSLPSTDIEKIMARRVLRSSASGGCSCGWCEVGHLKGQQLVNRIKELGYKNLKIGRPKSTNLAPSYAKRLLGETRNMEQRRSVKTVKEQLGGGSLMSAQRDRDRRILSR